MIMMILSLPAVQSAPTLLKLDSHYDIWADFYQRLGGKLAPVGLHRWKFTRWWTSANGAERRIRWTFSTSRR